MFGLTALETKLAGLAALLTLALITLLGFGWHERHLGAAKCQMDDAQVAAIQKAAQKAQEAVDAQRLKDAQNALQAEIVANAALRASLPTDHVVCIAPRAKPVPPAKGVPAAQPATAGALPAERPSDTIAFDPGPSLDVLFDEADDVVARCRELDNSLPH